MRKYAVLRLSPPQPLHRLMEFSDLAAAVWFRDELQRLGPPARCAYCVGVWSGLHWDFARCPLVGIIRMEPGCCSCTPRYKLSVQRFRDDFMRIGEQFIRDTQNREWDEQERECWCDTFMESSFVLAFADFKCGQCTRAERTGTRLADLKCTD